MPLDSTPLVLDIETTGLSLHRGAEIRWVGYKETTQSDVIIEKDPVLSYIYSHRVLAGHNIKFDLQFLRSLDEQAYNKWIADGGIVYDTQIAEYMLTGQHSKYATLDALSAKYGGTQKDTRVKDMMEAGIYVPDDLLIPYLEEDVDNTQLIMEKQQSDEEWPAIRKLFFAHMQFLLFLAECEWNGMFVDLEKNNEIIEKLSNEINELEYSISYLTCDGFNAGSGHHLAAWVYGGDITVTHRIPNGVYKSGKKVGEVRWKLKKETHTFPGITNSKPTLTDKGNVVVDDNILQEFSSDPVISLVLEVKKKQKMLSTYHAGFRDMQTGSVVRPSLNQCATATGRISCSSPNLQNVPRDSSDNEVKSVFISRYKGGNLIEIDFSQLEIVALAYLSKDKQLRQDILDKKDMHSIRAQELFDKKKIAKEQRTIAKVLSFQLQYGAGALAMAKKWKLSKKLCQKFIDLYYARYPEVKEWQDEMIKTVEISPSYPVQEKVVNGQPRRASIVPSITGRRYVFIQHKAPDFIRAKEGSEWSFKPTEIKNYFVQGFATGDVVPLALGMLYVLSKKQNILVLWINTVHDSALIDSKPEDTDMVIDWLRETISNVGDWVRQWLAPDFDLPLDCSISVGPSWAEMKEVKGEEK